MPRLFLLFSCILFPIVAVAALPPEISGSYFAGLAKITKYSEDSEISVTTTVKAAARVKEDGSIVVLTAIPLLPIADKNLQNSLVVFVENESGSWLARHGMYSDSAGMYLASVTLLGKLLKLEFSDKSLYESSYDPESGYGYAWWVNQKERTHVVFTLRQKNSSPPELP